MVTRSTQRAIGSGASKDICSQNARLNPEDARSTTHLFAGENLGTILFPENVGVKENRKTLLCKRSGGDSKIREIKNKNTARDGPGVFKCV